MAHMVETMAYTGEIPWHGLGVEVNNDMTPEQMRIAAGIDWKLIKQPVYSTTVDGRPVQIPNRFALMRDSDGKTYDIVSDLYKPTQPEDALDFFKKFVEAGDMRMETAGSLSDGKRIWALAKTREGFTLPGGDRCESYLLLHSPNELGKCLEAKWTSVRVVCHNTITAALSGTSQFRMAHFHEFKGDMHTVAETALGLAANKTQKFAETAEVLASSRVTEQQIYRYVATVFQPKLLEKVVDVQTAEAAASAGAGSVLDAIVDNLEASRAILQYSDFGKAGKAVLDSILESPGSDMASAKGTWWGAVNGVTHAIDHKLGRPDTRLEQAWFGHRERDKSKALDLAIQYATAAVAA